MCNVYMMEVPLKIAPFLQQDHKITFFSLYNEASLNISSVLTTTNFNSTPNDEELYVRKTKLLVCAKMCNDGEIAIIRDKL